MTAWLQLKVVGDVVLTTVPGMIDDHFRLWFHSPFGSRHIDTWHQLYRRDILDRNVTFNLTSIDIIPNFWPTKIKLITWGTHRPFEDLAFMRLFLHCSWVFAIKRKMQIKGTGLCTKCQVFLAPLFWFRTEKIMPAGPILEHWGASERFCKHWCASERFCNAEEYAGKNLCVHGAG